MRFLLVTLVMVGLLGAGAWWWFTRDTTTYAPSYSHARFAEIEPGMKLDEVYSLLGEPLAVRHDPQPTTWCYDDPGDGMQTRALGTEVVVSGFFEQRPCVRFDSDHAVSTVSGDGMGEVAAGMTAEQVKAILGEPSSKSAASTKALHYSRPGGESLFRARIVKIDAANRVSEIVTYQFYD